METQLKALILVLEASAATEVLVNFVIERTDGRVDVVDRDVPDIRQRRNHLDWVAEVREGPKHVVAVLRILEPTAAILGRHGQSGPDFLLDTNGQQVLIATTQVERGSVGFPNTETRTTEEANLPVLGNVVTIGAIGVWTAGQRREPVTTSRQRPIGATGDVVPRTALLVVQGRLVTVRPAVAKRVLITVEPKLQRGFTVAKRIVGQAEPR